MITYSEIMKYHNKLGLIWKLPTIPHESVILINELNPKDRVLDLGCGNGWVYHDVLLPAGYDGENNLQFVRASRFRTRYQLVRIYK